MHCLALWLFAWVLLGAGTSLSVSEMWTGMSHLNEAGVCFHLRRWFWDWDDSFVSCDATRHTVQLSRQFFAFSFLCVKIKYWSIRGNNRNYIRREIKSRINSGTLLYLISESSIWICKNIRTTKLFLTFLLLGINLWLQISQLVRIDLKFSNVSTNILVVIIRVIHLEKGFGSIYIIVVIRWCWKEFE